jgi:hypothetical protein
MMSDAAVREQEEGLDEKARKELDVTFLYQAQRLQAGDYGFLRDDERLPDDHHDSCVHQEPWNNQTPPPSLLEMNRARKFVQDDIFNLLYSKERPSVIMRDNKILSLLAYPSWKEPLQEPIPSPLPRQMRRELMERMPVPITPFMKDDMRRAVSAARVLRQSKLACKAFTILTCRRSDRSVLDVIDGVRARTITFATLQELSDRVEELDFYPQADNKLEHCVSRSLTILVELFNGYPIQQMQTVAQKLHLCALAVQILLVGLLSYCRAHLAAPLKVLVDANLRGADRCYRNKLAPYVDIKKMPLALTEVLFDDDVLVFKPSWMGHHSTVQVPEGPGPTYIRAASEEIADLWGPVDQVYCNLSVDDPSRHIYGLDMHGGILQPIVAQTSAGQMGHFHWVHGAPLVALHQQIPPFSYRGRVWITASQAAPFEMELN